MTERDTLCNEIEEARRRLGRQYERFPYPAPDDRIADVAAGELLVFECPRQNFHWYWPDRPPREDLRVLVAGCGTSQAAELAVSAPGAQITAVDLSAQSLNFTQTLMDKHGIGNLALKQMPLEEVETLGLRFDLVVSTGVLHHLKVPERGLNALAQVLEPDGRMFLMLYGKDGRHGVYLLQRFFRALGFSGDLTDKAALAELRQAVERLPADHPFALAKHRFIDWHDDNGFVDLFLNVCDRGYTLTEFGSFLASAGLSPQKLLYRAHYSPACLGLASGRIGNALEKMDDWSQLCAGEAYRGAVKKHFIIAGPRQTAAPTKPMINAKTAKTLIPRRMPGLEVRRHNGQNVLYWPGHQFNDLTLGLSDVQLAVLQDLDGTVNLRQVADLMAKKTGDPRVRSAIFDLADTLFEYDFISFAGAGAA